MSSLVERLRERSNRRPIYNIDETDDDADFLPRKHGTTQEKFDRIVRSDAKEDSCQACGESGALVNCETCTYTFHSSCLLQPFKSPLSDHWKCPECVSPLNDIDKILDCETCPTVAGENDATKLGPNQKYLVKWKGLSYLHCKWVPEEEFLKAFKKYPRLRTKINNFHRQMASVSLTLYDIYKVYVSYNCTHTLLVR